MSDHLEAREVGLGLRQRARRDVDRQSFRLAVEAIGCNLAWAAQHAPERPIAVPLSNGVMWAQGRYGNPVYGAHFRAALAAMAHPEIAFVKQLSRGFRLASGRSQPTTVAALPAFYERVPVDLAGGGSLARAALGEVLILRGSKDASGRSSTIDYRDTANTRRRRKEVEGINRHLEAAPFWLLPDDLTTDSDGQPIDLARRSVVRIFNNGSWHAGGRLFGGLWETMRREDRFRLLRIGTAACPDGERIANVDFQQLFPTLAYLEIGREPPPGDLYDIIGDGSARDGWKRLTNALLFATKPLKQWPEGSASLFPRGAKLADALASIREKHAPIAHLFGSGIGFKLMLLESEILLLGLSELLASGVTALPLHDSVLVGESEAEQAKEVLGRAYAVFTSDARAKLEIDIDQQ